MHPKPPLSVPDRGRHTLELYSIGPRSPRVPVVRRIDRMSEPLPAASPAVPAAPPDPAATAARKAMLIVFLVVVVDLLGFGIVLPILPVTGDDYVKALFPLK